jgi:hypothetical protein
VQIDAAEAKQFGQVIGNELQLLSVLIVKAEYSSILGGFKGRIILRTSIPTAASYPTRLSN